MSLIKSRDATGVQGLILRSPAGSPPAHPLEAELSRAQAEILVLRDALSSAVATAAELTRAQEDALRSARAEAWAAGQAEGRAAADRVAETLKTGLEDAAQRLAAVFAAHERLAVSLAHEGLARILQDPAQQSTLVRDALIKQVRALEAAAILEAKVSAIDFPDAESQQGLTEALAAAGVSLRVSTQLPAGGCDLRLKLGELDVSVGQQWGRLSEILESLGLGENAA